MASTNKTTNYELSQFLGTDKPAWLSDYNADMAKIDAQMKLNADAATAADGKAVTNATNIGTLANLTTDEKTSIVAAINEVDGHADTAQNTATGAAQLANTNSGLIQALEGYLDLNTFTNPSVSAVGGTLNTTNTNISCASNTDGTLGKIYGRIYVDSTTSTTTLSFATPFRPTSALTINGIAVRQWADSPYTASSFSQLIPISVEVATDGTASLEITGSTNGRRSIINIMACLIFFKSFGDTIITE